MTNNNMSTAYLQAACLELFHFAQLRSWLDKQKKTRGLCLQKNQTALALMERSHISISLHELIFS